MTDTKRYPVKSRLRRSGTVYEPGGENPEVELTEKEAAPLLALKTIGDPVADVAEPDTGTGDPKAGEDFDLAASLKALMDQGHDIAEMNMDKILPLLGNDGKGVKRKDVDAALAKLAKAGDGGSE